MFKERLRRASSRNASLLCVGLDPHIVPVEHVVAFNRAIIDATSDLVCSYKPNLAIYDHMGSHGSTALRETLTAIPAHIPKLGDWKRADIGNCGKVLAEIPFDQLGFDSVTIYAYMGYEAVEPYLDYKDKAVFIVCRSSNPRAHEMQDGLYVGSDGVQRPYYMELARIAHDDWDKHGTVGFVVGATAPEALMAVRDAYPDVTILVPGIGVQGGSLESAVKYGINPQGDGLILSVSRSIIYAYTDDPEKLLEDSRTGFERSAAEARKAAEDFRVRINRVRERIPVTN